MTEHRTTIGNKDGMQEYNRRNILKLLLTGEVYTRTEVATHTGLTQAAISRITAQMMECGLMEEVGVVNGKKGRRSIGIRINANYCKVIAVKITRRSFEIWCKNWSGDVILCKEHTDVNVLEGAEYVMERIKLSIHRLLERFPEVKAIGVAVPGPYLKQQGRIALMSEFNGWDKINIVEDLGNEFGIPVLVEHDANAGALAEWNRAKLDKEDSVLVHLLVSEGVGAGIIVNGSMLTGRNGIAGEVGHMSINVNGPRCACGNRGCLEQYCSAISFARMVSEDIPLHPESSLNGTEQISAAKVFAHMEQGDRFSEEQVKKVGFYLGCGVANIINAYAPSAIVISDIMAGGGKTFLDAVAESAKSRVLPDIFNDVEISLSKGKDPILEGAGLLAAEYLVNHPNELFVFDNMEEEEN